MRIRALLILLGLLAGVLGRVMDMLGVEARLGNLGKYCNVVHSAWAPWCVGKLWREGIGSGNSSTRFQRRFHSSCFGFHSLFSPLALLLSGKLPLPYLNDSRPSLRPSSNTSTRKLYPSAAPFNSSRHVLSKSFGVSNSSLCNHSLNHLTCSHLYKLLTHFICARFLSCPPVDLLCALGNL